MKFGRFFESSIIPEWKAAYLDYKLLKKEIKICKKAVAASIPKTNVVDDTITVTAHDLESVKFGSELEGNRALLAEMGFGEKQEEGSMFHKSHSQTSSSGQDLSEVRATAEAIQMVATSVINEVDTQFQVILDSELHKVNDFYIKKEEQYLVTFSDLKANARELIAQKSPKSDRSVLKLAFQEFHRAIGLLKNFSILNFTGFVKILKKYDKYTGSGLGIRYLAVLHESEFVKSSTLKQMEAEVEVVFAKAFCQGRKSEAMSELRIQSDAKNDDMVVLRAGIFGGICLPVLALLLYEFFAFWPPADSTMSALMPAHVTLSWYLYRLAGFPVLLFFLFAINIYIWERGHVNHVFIFELNPRKHLARYNYFEIAGFLVMIWLVSAYVYVKSTILEMQEAALRSHDLTHVTFDDNPSKILAANMQPTALIMFLFVLFALPFPIFFASARLWLWRVLGRIAFAPFFAVRFADFFIADQLTSLGEFMFDFQYIMCFVVDSKINQNPAAFDFCAKGFVSALPVLNALPFWWRLMQCVRRYWDSGDVHPHLTNAGKYGSHLVAMVFAFIDIEMSNGAKGWTKYKTMWLIAMLFSTCYKMWWDFRMDWGLFPPSKKKQKIVITPDPAAQEMQTLPAQQQTPLPAVPSTPATELTSPRPGSLKSANSESGTSLVPPNPAMIPVLVQGKGRLAPLLTFRPLNHPVSMSANKAGSNVSPMIYSSSKSKFDEANVSGIDLESRNIAELSSPLSDSPPISPDISPPDSPNGSDIEEDDLDTARSHTPTSTSSRGSKKSSVLDMVFMAESSQSHMDSPMRVRPDHAVRSLIQNYNDVDDDEELNFPATSVSAHTPTLDAEIEEHHISQDQHHTVTFADDCKFDTTATAASNKVVRSSSISGLAEKMQKTKERRHKRYRWLRKQLMYEPIAVYYLAIAENFVFRFTWLFVLIAKYGFGATKGMGWVSLCVSVAEIFRRFVWNIFRLENEHMNNCDNFRAVKEIPLPIYREGNLNQDHVDEQKEENAAFLTSIRHPSKLWKMLRR